MHRIFSLTQHELRTLRRLTRFWTIVFVLTVYLVLGYAVSCLFMVHHAPSSPTFGANSPLYALSGIDPKFFLLFQMATLALVFDTPHRNVRCNIQEVIDSRPASSFEYLLSRVLSVVFLMWLVMLFNVLAMQIVGLLAETIRWEFVGTFQLHSVFNLTVFDAPVHLLFWSSFFVLLCTFTRFRLLTLLCGLMSILVWFGMSHNVSFAMHSLISPSSNDSLFVSDLIPELAPLPTLWLRGATVIGSLALLVVSSTLKNRIDRPSPFLRMTQGSTLLILAVTVFIVGAKILMTPYDLTARWKEDHAKQSWNDTLDLLSMAGTMIINPHRQLKIDLTLTYSLKSSHTEDRLLFSMNPGLKIQSLKWNGQDKRYTFRNGLLELYDINHLDTKTTHTMRVVTQGVPDPRFAYFDSAIDIFSDRHFPRQLVRLFGKDGTIFHKNFIALMPGAHWYPKQGTVKDLGPWSTLSRDYFDVDLKVDLVADHWQLVASTEFSSNTSETSNYHLHSLVPVPELAIFASRFHKVSKSIDEFTLDIYTHASHAENLKLLDELDYTLGVKVQKLLTTDTNIDVLYPRKQIAMVEVPRRLRTIGGGWRMDSLQAFPGIVLMKEHSFPKTKFKLLFDRLRARKRDFDSTDQIDRLTRYFSYGLGSENPLMDAPKHNWLHVTSAVGEYALVLDLVAMELIALLRSTDNGFFSIYSTSHIVNRTILSPFAAVDALADAYTFFNSLSTWVRKTRSFEVKYGSRLSVQDIIERVGFTDVPSSFGHQYDFELVLHKSREIALGLLSVNKSQNVNNWLKAMLQSFQGRNYDYEEMLDLAKSHKILIEPFLTEWVTSSALPGYIVSNAVCARIADNDQKKSRFQTTFQIKNVQPVSGFVHVSYPTEESVHNDYPEYVTWDEAILMEKNSAKRVNLETFYELPNVRLEFGLSLNRDPLIIATSNAELLVEQGAPFVQSSHWSPESVGIVVDDLDPGFSIPELKDVPRSQKSIGLFRWIQTLDGEAVVEFDHYLPKYDVSYERFYRYHWTRVVSDSQRTGGYGRFRRTWAEVLVDSRNKYPPPAKFSVKIPKTMNWKLEYYAPMLAHDIYDGPFPLRFTISDNSKQIVHDIRKGKWKRGWNTVGVFDLVEGNVDVAVSISGRVPSPGDLLFADAIRWSLVQP